MSKELFVSSTPHETKVAVVEDDLLAEVYFERENEYTLAGSIYKGRVTRVLPGMQSAFVDIGLERDAFLYVSDFLLEEEEDADGLDQAVARSRPEVFDAAPASSHPVGAEDVTPAAEPHAAPRSDQEAASGSADDQEEGARRWRGRRRRGRGRSGRFEDSPAPRESAPAPQPRHEPAAAPDRLVLPGESISKYQPQGSAKPEASAPPVPQNRPRPSTEYSFDPGQFSADSMVLPGESISKYRDGESRPPRRSRAAAQQEVRDDSGASAPSAPAEEHGYSGLSVPESAPQEEPSAHLHSQEPDSREVERLEHMNVASVFAGDEAETTDVIEAAPGETEAEVIEEETEPAAQEAAAAPAEPDAREQQPWYAPGSGNLEQEEIQEEDEGDLPGFEETFDLSEFEELEEEVLDPVDDQLVPMAGEITDAVRDAHIEERATGDYEALSSSPESDYETEELEASEPGQDQDEATEDGSGEPDELENARAEQRASAGVAGFQQRTERRGDRRGGQRRPGRRMRGGGRPRPHSQRSLPAISDLLKEGQEILVQIAKEPIAKKGARITSHIALPGRFLVYMPTVHHTGVSRKIGSDEERQRLKRIVISERGEASGGFIVRTAASGASEEDLRADIRFLINLWTEIKNRSESAKAPALIYHDLNLVERILRDQVTTSFSAIWVDTEQEYERILRFVSRFQNSLVKRVKLYTKETPLFEQFGISDEINKALKSKVWLKSGGYIVINQTEALVAIDVNTGKFVGKTARLEDTIVKTNIDAIREIVRQIRLRDLGGIIVIDFIDMDERKNRHKVMAALEDALKADRAPSKVLQFNDFGLVAITRKRVKQSLERTLGQPCPTCSATGMIKSVTTVCNEIYIEMRKMNRHFERDIMLRANPEVAKALKANGARWLQEMEELTGRTILVKSDPLLHPEQFDIQ